MVIDESMVMDEGCVIDEGSFVADEVCCVADEGTIELISASHIDAVFEGVARGSPASAAAVQGQPPDSGVVA